jgi:hypothetical protein
MKLDTRACIARKQRRTELPIAFAGRFCSMFSALLASRFSRFVLKGFAASDFSLGNIQALEPNAEI